MTDVAARPEMQWNAWGSADAAKPLSPELRALIAQTFGVDTEKTVDTGGTVDTERTAPDAVALRACALSAGQRQNLVAVVGAAHLSTEHRDRLLHAGGKSTFDLLRRRAVEIQQAPDAVVSPATHDEVLEVLACCAADRIAVVPFGGGTSVVGGVDPERGGFAAVIALDLRRLDTLTAVDPISRTATLGAGLTGPQAEQLLAAHGFSLGHFPQSFQFASIGGFAATRSSGQASAGYGRFEDMIERLDIATPRGGVSLGRAPASAAGPDLRELFAGSEGVFGVITAVTLRVHPVPAHTVYRAWSFPDFSTGAAALRTVAQAGAAPTVMRMSDEAETGMNLAMSDRIGSSAAATGCLAITTFEGSAEHVEARAGAVSALLCAAGGTDLGAEPARRWEHGRFGAPYLRDALLDAGVLAETLETATSWANLLRLKSAVTDALTAALPAPVLVLCHISHTYPAGASLYFTVACAQASDPIAQWRAAKRAACDAIVAAGGTITHHHAVGADHREWLPAEVGDLGVEILRAVKDVVDPTGILNPGKLLP